MTDFFLGGRVIDAILALAAFETLALCGWRAMTGRGPALLPLAANLLAGAFLLLALRFALGDQSRSWIALCLSAALVAHLADLRLRWEAAPQRAARPTSPPNMKATISLRVAKSAARPRKDVAPGA